MQDIKRNKRKKIMNTQIPQLENQTKVEEKYTNDALHDFDRGYGYKPKPNNNHGCHIDNHCNHYHNSCEDTCKCEFVCECHPKKQCEPCEIDTKQCVKNNCAQECCNPISLQKYSTSNSIPYAIEANRVYDTMAFQTFTDAVGPNGEALIFDYDVIEVCGPIPKTGNISIEIEEVCINYGEIVIYTGCTSLEDYEIQPLESLMGKHCDTTFEYAVCGQKDRKCNSKCKGTSVAYKERGLNITVHNLVLELKGKCGCTEIKAFAYPAIRGVGGQIRRCPEVEFIFNTLTAPICLPSDGRNIILRQDFNTNITVDCIGKAILRYVNHDGCECYYDLCIPNDIDLVLCLQSTVSTLINEQIVVLGSPNALKPRIVDTFNKVCDFSNSCEEVEHSHNNCGCGR